MFDFVIYSEDQIYLIEVKAKAPDIGTLSYYTRRDAIKGAGLESKPYTIVFFTPGTASPSANEFALENNIKLCNIDSKKDIDTILQECLV